MKNYSRIYILFNIGLLLGLSACASPGATALATSTWTSTPDPLWMPVITALQTATPTVSPTAAPTATPLPSATPTPLLLVLAGTLLPPPVAPIEVANAAQVSALAEWQSPNVVDLSWTPDGQVLAVANPTTIELYGLASREKLRTLYPQVEGTVDIAFSPRGSWLVSGSRRGSEQGGYFSTLELWSGPDWKPHGILYDTASALSSMDFSPDGRSLVIAFTSSVYEQNSVVFWDVPTWSIAQTLETGTALKVAISLDNNLLAVTPDRYAIRVWDLIEWEWLYTLPTSFTGAVQEIAFSPDKVTLATGHYDGAIHLWDTLTGKHVLDMAVEEVIQSMAFSPDGLLLATGGSYYNSLVRIWDARTGALLRTLDGHTHSVDKLAFSPNGAYLASASYDGTVRLWGIRP